jgi:hypothetical protein
VGPPIQHGASHQAVHKVVVRQEFVDLRGGQGEFPPLPLGKPHAGGQSSRSVKPQNRLQKMYNSGAGTNNDPSGKQPVARNVRGPTALKAGLVHGQLTAHEARGRNNSLQQRDMNPYDNHIVAHVGTKKYLRHGGWPIPTKTSMDWRRDSSNMMMSSTGAVTSNQNDPFNPHQTPERDVKSAFNHYSENISKQMTHGPGLDSITCLHPSR